MVTVFRVSSISFSCTSLTAGASLELDISSSMDAQITNNKPNAVVDIFLINLLELGQIRNWREHRPGLLIVQRIV